MPGTHAFSRDYYFRSQATRRPQTFRSGTPVSPRNRSSASRQMQRRRALPRRRLRHPRVSPHSSPPLRRLSPQAHSPPHERSPSFFGADATPGRNRATGIVPVSSEPAPVAPAPVPSRRHLIRRIRRFVSQPSRIRVSVHGPTPGTPIADNPRRPRFHIICSWHHGRIEDLRARLAS